MPKSPKKRLVVLRDSYGLDSFSGFQRDAADEVISLEDLRHWVVTGYFFFKLFQYSECLFLVYRVEFIPKPFFVALVLRFLTQGGCSIQDGMGRVREVSWGYTAQKLRRWIGDALSVSGLIGEIEQEVEKRQSMPLEKKRPVLNLRQAAVYLRTDMAFGVQSGGSVGHIAGVLNHLDAFAGSPIFLTSDAIPTVRTDIESHVLPPGERFWDFREVPSLGFNNVFYPLALSLIEKRELSFIYQRYSLNDYSGLRLARERNIPFILEFNGSEIWVSRHWGKPLKYEALSEKIEMMNLEAADLVVVVSKPLRNELAARGIKPEKILINPNGVDAEKYSTKVDGLKIRQRYGLEGKKVIGFIGTFGKWHGAEVLADAFGRLIQMFPEYRATARLLMIGDGVTKAAVEENLRKYGVSDLAVLTGAIPQSEGPVHLAACDILTAPHVPNADGTPFFGSPTKLFEYMAMGKGIVASDLDQIGEVLQQDVTAWMVKPGDPESLMMGLKTLLDDEARRNRLGKAAREEVVLKYTWKAHTQKIVEKLKEIYF